MRGPAKATLRLEQAIHEIVAERAPITALPSFDATTKDGDVRFKWYAERYGLRAWELDAMDPNALRARVREQIESRLDLLRWEHAKKIEHAEVQSMREFHRQMQHLLSRADDAYRGGA